MKLAQIFFGAAAAGELAWLAIEGPGPAGVHWMAVSGLVLLSAYLCVHLRASLNRARYLLLLACFAVIALACGLPWWVALALPAAAWLASLRLAAVELPSLFLLFLAVLLFRPR